ncbi:sulfopyruvate decarboxylase subunit beta (plasmid) [Fulvitalea axinellae]|uniref:Sulfopyruvate decarboxylase subunit beta n=1 Tax=Fulvitalea axinellae TaxID=1182444 RepID=A0AAU9CRE8_9BACT|nr:sulfopyruvate decarboxylase subunit beta [Fulvitalea axinellae]
MINVASFYNCLLNQGVEFFTGVPDSLLKNICAYIKDHTVPERNIIAANEGASVALAAGYHMATGNIPMVYLQNSGLGNTVNPLLSLADEDVYKIPMLLMVGWRGEPGGKDEPQHVKQGKVTLDLLDAMGVPYKVLEQDSSKAEIQISELVDSIKATGIPHALVIKKSTFSDYKLKSLEEACALSMSRESAMKLVVDRLSPDDVVVSTTGKLSRELFEYREALGQGHEKDFLTVGSMGHCSAIALGIALEKPERAVYCFDGDGAVIMHAGNMATVGSLSPSNYRHIVFNNGAHESVGGQPTVGFEISIPEMALASCYKRAFSVETETELVEALEESGDIAGPVLIEIKVKIDSRKDLGRPTSSPKENKDLFMKFIR